MVKYFKNWKQFHKASKKIYSKWLLFCPELLLMTNSPKVNPRLSEALDGLMSESMALWDRLPSQARDYQLIRSNPAFNPKNPFPDSSFYVFHWEKLLTGKPVPDADDRQDEYGILWDKEVQLGKELSNEPRNKICKSCGKWSFFDPERIPDTALKYLQKKEYVWYDYEGNVIFEYTFKKFPHRNYCSENCYKKARNEKRRKEKITLICPFCQCEYQTRLTKPAKTCRKSNCKKRFQRDKKNLC